MIDLDIPECLRRGTDNRAPFMDVTQDQVAWLRERAEERRQIWAAHAVSPAKQEQHAFPWQK